jgi:universal stress protein E
MTQFLRQIVAGTSLDRGSDAVVAAALKLRRQTGASLHLVHAFPLPMAFGSGLYPVPPQVDLDAERERALALGQLERLGGTSGELASLVVEMETPHRLIARVAEAVGADLIVVGASETSAALQPFLGSTADRVLRHTRHPVLVVRGALPELKKVLLPVDLSEVAEACLKRGLPLLDAFGGDPELEALFVLNPMERDGNLNFRPEQVERFAHNELDLFVGRLGRHARQIVRCGNVRDEILSYAKDHTFDLVLLATHGRGGFERFLLGSVTAELLRRLEVSALVVPAEIKSAG